MSRDLAFVLIVTSIVAAGWNASELAMVLSRTPAHALAERGAPQARPQTATPDHTKDTSGHSRLDWPPIFGVPDPQPVAVAADMAETEFRDPAAGFRLTGLVSTGSGKWAFVSELDAEVLVRPGDTLENGAVVVEIGEEGVAVQIGEHVGLIRFANSAPVDSVRIAVQLDDYSAPVDTVVHVQNISPEKLSDMIVRANESRKRRAVLSQGRPPSQ